MEPERFVSENDTARLRAELSRYFTAPRIEGLSDHWPAVSTSTVRASTIARRASQRISMLPYALPTLHTNYRHVRASPLRSPLSSCGCWTPEDRSQTNSASVFSFRVLHDVLYVGQWVFYEKPAIEYSYHSFLTKLVRSSHFLNKFQMSNSVSFVYFSKYFFSRKIEGPSHYKRLFIRFSRTHQKKTFSKVQQSGNRERVKF